MKRWALLVVAVALAAGAALWLARSSGTVEPGPSADGRAQTNSPPEATASSEGARADPTLARSPPPRTSETARASNAEPPRLTFDGRVVDVATRAPVAGVKVVVPSER